MRHRSPISVAPRRGTGGAVIAPMAPAAFINPAVIQRTAALAAAGTRRPAEPFRYREGIALGGSAATLPLRYAAAGVLSGTQAAVLGRGACAAVGEASGSASALSKILPSSGFGPAADRLEDWNWHMSVDGAHGRRAQRARGRRRRRPPRLPGDRADAGRGRAAPGRARAHAGAAPAA